MRVLDEFQCINCEFLDEYFRDSSEVDVVKVCPNCGNEMRKVFNAPVINDSKSLTFVNISPERKFEIKRERLAVKGKFNKSKKVREEAKVAAADMGNFKS
jgi:putative FmdB family regulatory protein